MIEPTSLDHHRIYSPPPPSGDSCLFPHRKLPTAGPIPSRHSGLPGAPSPLVRTAPRLQGGAHCAAAPSSSPWRLSNVVKNTHRLTVSRSPPGGILGMISLDCPVFLSLHNHPAFTEDLLSHRFYGVDAPTRPPRVELVSKKFHLRPCGIPSARGSDHFGLFNVLTPLSHTASHYFFPSLSIYPTLLQK